MNSNLPLQSLLERLKGATASDAALNEAAARALGWKTRKVTGLGLNGRTPGRIMWFGPYFNKGRAKPPAFSGPKMRPTTIRLLQALIASKSPSEPSA